MLRPEPMTRVLVVGPRERLEGVIGALYDLKLLHLVDHRGEDEVFSIGKPLPSATEISDRLVRLRSIASLLRVEEISKVEGEEKAPAGDIRAQIVTLEVNLREEDDARKRMEGLLQDLDRRTEELTPFASLGLPLEAYAGYESIEAVVGRVAEEVRDLEAVTKECEVVRGDRAVAVFVAKEHAEKVRERLARFGFAALEVPKGQGDPRALLAAAKADREKWAVRLSQVKERIDKLRGRYAGFLVKAESLLRVEIEKAEAPLRFAASEHSFVVDGWVPSARAADFTKALAAMPGLHVEVLGEARGSEEGEEAPPVLLRNRGPVRRFEFLTKLYSTPRHDEVDPTSFLFLLFPVFFGLMIGDVGYGIAMILLGLGMGRLVRDNKDFADLMRIVLYGGVFALIFGIVLFGDMFGIPFHAPPEAPEEMTWSAIFGFEIPYYAPIHKLETIGVVDMLFLSVVASFVHLALSFVIGFANEVRHDKRHAASRIGWLFVLVGFLSFFAVLGRTPEWCALSPTNTDCIHASHRVVNVIFFDQLPLAWIPAEGIPLGSMVLPWFSLASLLVGIGILVPTEGPLASVETVSLLANMMSYTRLAGVAVAKGAVAFAFNTMFLPLIVNWGLWDTQGILQLNPNPVMIVVGFVFMFLAHGMVLILGAISAGIQALRLNYVEFFLKFFKGGGSPFSPFGARKPTEA